MAHIVDDLLALSQFDYGQKTLQLKRLDFSDLVIEVCEQQRNQAKSKGVDVELPKTVPVVMEGDSARLRQMVRNVLDNAIKYTPSGGKVYVELDRSGEEVLLRVSDTGIGIPANALPNIFDRFYRVDQARTREEGGSGLGLSIVKQIIEADGGEEPKHADRDQRPDEKEVSAGAGEAARDTDALPLHVDVGDEHRKERSEEHDDVARPPPGKQQRSVQPNAGNEHGPNQV